MHPRRSKEKANTNATFHLDQYTREKSRFSDQLKFAILLEW